MNRFVIYKNPYKDKDNIVSSAVYESLKSLGAEVSFFEDYKGDFSEDVMTVVLGGDGTILQAIRETGFMLGPVIGVNLGKLGFLTEIEPDQVKEAMSHLVKGDFTIENRLLLEGSVNEGEKVRALNDVVLTRSGSLRICGFNIKVNGQPLADYLADGMIVSTPTGSTGYNLSAGGPIASPASELIILTPICPHTLNHRSMILSDRDEVVIEIPASKDGGEQEMELSFDGNSRKTVRTGDVIRIKSSGTRICFAKLGKDSFLEILNKKMSE